MALKRRGGSPKKVATGVSHDNEWVPSLMGEMELNEMVEVGVLPDRITAGWRRTDGEPYLMPHTDELVVLEDYFWHGLGLPIHPFLQDLLEYWGVSLCSLNLNTILHISMFIHFCEVYLGILPHFNLFRHFFWLKKKGGVIPKLLAVCIYSSMMGWRVNTLLCH